MNVGRLIIAGLVAAVLFFALWPAMWVAPVSTLQTVRDFVMDAGAGGMAGRGIFFWGEIYPDDPGPAFYPVAFLFRVTPPALLGLLAAMALPVKNRWRSNARWALVGYLLIFALSMTMGAKKYDRYLMPLFPIVDVLAALGLLQLARLLFSVAKERLNPQWKPWLWPGFAGLMLLWAAVTALPHLPYYYTYYNPLLGGPKTASRYIQVGFAEGIDKMGHYLQQLPNANTLKVASGYSSKLEGIFFGQPIELENLDGNWVRADYVFLYLSQLQRGKNADDIVTYLQRAPSIHTVQLHGVDYAWLYPGPALQNHVQSDTLTGRGTLWGYTAGATELQVDSVAKNIVTVFAKSRLTR
jgi:hypothetical protein